mmetsp:Transcript_81491/g.170423  ORF Transcript_81491/g.170423 Transcript_81491/m.170423 type:complete len:339 (-) Transcript_81491:92-1108(-)
MDERYTIATGISQRRADPSIKLLVTPIFPRNPFWRLVGTTHRLIQKIFVDVDSLAATARPQPIQEVEAVPTSSERDGLLLLDLQEEGVRDRLRVLIVPSAGAEVCDELGGLAEDVPKVFDLGAVGRNREGDLLHRDLHEFPVCLQLCGSEVQAFALRRDGLQDEVPILPKLLCRVGEGVVVATLAGIKPIVSLPVRPRSNCFQHDFPVAPKFFGGEFQGPVVGLERQTKQLRVAPQSLGGVLEDIARAGSDDGGHGLAVSPQRLGGKLQDIPVSTGGGGEDDLQVPPEALGGKFQGPGRLPHRCEHHLEVVSTLHAGRLQPLALLGDSPEDLTQVCLR